MIHNDLQCASGSMITAIGRNDKGNCDGQIEEENQKFTGRREVI
jgi:hypothetical protein